MTKNEAIEIGQKYNDSCLKLLTMIKLLYEGDVEPETLLNLLAERRQGSTNANVTLNKYLNAMKIFGLKVKKVNGMYRMASSLYKIKFGVEDFKCINLLKGACNLFPEGKTKSNLSRFLNDLEIRFDESTMSLSQVADNTENLHLSFHHSEMLEQYKKCEEYCQQKNQLDIIYITAKGNSVHILCSPVETVYQKSKIYLNVLDKTGRIHEIPIRDIKSIKQMPSLSSSQGIATTVVFKVKNRLAHNYRIRDWERLQNIEADGSRIIINKTEDLNVLLNRLMRYGRQCEILSPKSFREEMVELINKTLSNYQ